MSAERRKFSVRRPVYFRRYQYIVVEAISEEDALLQCKNERIWEPVFKNTDDRLAWGLPEVVEEIRPVIKERK